jgi:hypothetical protein
MGIGSKSKTNSPSEPEMFEEITTAPNDRPLAPAERSD